MRCDGILAEMRSLYNAENVAGMARYGIGVANAYGLPMPALRAMAKRIGEDHGLAQELWTSGIHEARILACLIDDPRQVTEEQMETWVVDFDSWDICDGCCGNLFDRTVFAFEKAAEWSRRSETYVKRAGYVLMAGLAVHDKSAGDEAFVGFLPLILEGATDDRNFVKKAVNWALRQIGKRNVELNGAAIETARQIQKLDSKSARWIASDALRELTSQAVQSRLQRE